MILLSLVPELPLPGKVRLILLSALVSGYASLALLVAVLYGAAFFFGRSYMRLRAM